MPADLKIKSDDHPLGVGDDCRLNSGGPTMLVVDVDNDILTVSWPDKRGIPQETTFPRACVRRA